MNGIMEFGMKFVKFFLCLLSFIFLVAGIFTVTIGSIISINYDNFDLFLASYHVKPVLVVIAFGAFTITISFFGCLGAIKKSTILVNLFALLLFILLLVEVALAIAITVYCCDIGDTVEANMRTGMGSYKSNEHMKASWDLTQEVLQCCGVRNSIGWAKYHVPGHVVTISKFKYTVPKSCCTTGECYEIYDKGCLTVLGNYVDHSTKVLLYIAFGNIVVKIFAIILAVMLAKSIRRIKSQKELERMESNMPRVYEATSGTPSGIDNSFGRLYGSDP
ncbi:hypothetical protein FQA39_LY01150 [Lamprigera yunnana]|nr:hypothetical protein FQA39_LY01150 [Lamprigera yunnana]